MDHEHEGSTIMIVDDTPENLELLAEMLQAKGFQTVQFPRGQMALNAAMQNTPDLILLDIMMPGLNGFEVCYRLKCNDTLKEVPVIFISALNDTESIVQAFSQGGVDYVTKPFREDEVISRVKTHLTIKKQREEIKKLLNNTFIGAIRSLNELLAISCPEAYRKTLKVNQYLRTFCAAEKVKNAWMVEVASSMSNLGNLVPGKNEDHNRSTDPHVEEIAAIIGRIPRLEQVAAMVEQSVKLPILRENWREWSVEKLGGQLLSVTSALEHRLEQGLSEVEALREMSELTNPTPFHPQLLKDFAQVVFGVDLDDAGGVMNQASIQVLEVGLMDLEANFVLAENLVTREGMTMLAKGTQLTQSLCVLIRKRNEWEPLRFPIKVFCKETDTN